LSEAGRKATPDLVSKGAVAHQDQVEESEGGPASAFKFMDEPGLQERGINGREDRSSGSLFSIHPKPTAETKATRTLKRTLERGKNLTKKRGVEDV